MNKNIQCRTRERKDKSKYTICYEPEKKPTQNKKADNNIMKKQPSTPKARKKPEEATPAPRLLQLEATAGTPRRARIPEGRPPNLDAQRKAIDRLALAATGELDLLARETNIEIDKIFSAPATVVSGQTTRNKKISIKGLAANEIKSILEGLVES